MPIKKVTLLYTYDELSDTAKAKARDWYRESASMFFSDEVEYDDFMSICDALGVQVAVDNRGKSPTPKIYWSGFSSQGDGASFHGRYEAKPDAAEAIRAYAGQDEKLHAIGDALSALAKQWPGLTANVSQPYGSHYSHAHTMYVTDLDFGTGDDDELIPQEVFLAVEADLQGRLRDLANWLYRWLEAEYAYRTSDEEAESAMEANDYTFTVDGKRES